jgi:hypothetical protein
MSKEYKIINSEKFKSIGQKELEQMNGTREMSNEERKKEWEVTPCETDRRIT